MRKVIFYPLACVPSAAVLTVAQNPAAGGKTPGITRRPASFQEFGKQRVGGRVHVVVMRMLRFTTPSGFPLNFTLRLRPVWRRSSPGRTAEAGVLRSRIVAEQGHSVLIARVNLIGDAFLLVAVVVNVPDLPIPLLLESPFGKITAAAPRER